MHHLSQSMNDQGPTGHFARKLAAMTATQQEEIAVAYTTLTRYLEQNDPEASAALKSND